MSRKPTQGEGNNKRLRTSNEGDIASRSSSSSTSATTSAALQGGSGSQALGRATQPLASAVEPSSSASASATASVAPQSVSAGQFLGRATQLLTSAADRTPSTSALSRAIARVVADRASTSEHLSRLDSSKAKEEKKADSINPITHRR